MKTSLLTLAALVLCVSLANADNATRPKGIINSPHNLSYTSQFQGTTSSQICVFCHTPHNAIQTAPTAALWNHTTNPSTTYTPFSGITYTGATTLNPNRSLVCLSCHDGQLAVTDLRNPLWQFSTGTSVAAVAGNGGLDASFKVQNVSGASGTFNPNVGTDLSNDHPVGFVYPLNTTYDSTSAPKYNQNINVASYSLPTGGTAYVNPWNSAAFTAWNANSNNFPMNKQKVTLYYNSASQPQVECMSCHDVHNSKGFVKLLAESNDQSALCRDCHYSK